MTSCTPPILLAVLGLFAPGAAMAEPPAPTEPIPEKPAEIARIGTYDSRAVAVAYCGTSRHEAEVRRLDEALKEAKAAGDAARIKEADRAVWDARKRLHRQGFSTHPVEDILAQIPEEVKRIQAEVNAGLLVSKWDEKALAKYPTAERVDVTERLVDAVKPSDRQRRRALEIVKIKPIPPKEYEELLKQEVGEHY